MVLILVLLKHPIIKLLSFLALSISSYVLGPFGLGLGHGSIWPLTFLAKLALHNTGAAAGHGGPRAQCGCLVAVLARAPAGSSGGPAGPNREPELALSD